MAIKSINDKARGPIEIDLTGPEGNAFVLLGYAKRYAKQLGYDPIAQQDIITEMMSGSYDELVDIFDKYFGDYVTLYR
jgi:hypothetical protein